MQNDTNRIKEFTTTAGTKIVMLDWINGREHQQINAPMFAQMKMKPGQNGVETSSISMDVALLIDNEAIKHVIKSVNGQSANVFDLVQDLPVDEYNEVLAEVRESMKGKKKS
jgi:hypothetical protein